jgi:hypothetical protein
MYLLQEPIKRAAQAATGARLAWQLAIGKVMHMHGGHMSMQRRNYRVLT